MEFKKEANGRGEEMPKLSSQKRLEDRYALLRFLDSKYAEYNSQHLKLRPPHGTIAVGSAHMDPWFLCVGLEAAIRELRSGKTQEEATEAAYRASSEAVTLWNSKVEYQRHRDLKTAYDKLRYLILLKPSFWN